MNYAPYTAAIQDLLTEVNALKGLDLEFHPRSDDYPMDAAYTLNVSYKLHRKSDEDRIMSLAVNLFNGFEQLPSPNGSIPLTAEAKEEILDAIQKFWSVGNGERLASIEICPFKG